jgi:hypothetical protein
LRLHAPGLFEEKHIRLADMAALADRAELPKSQSWTSLCSTLKVVGGHSASTRLDQSLVKVFREKI